MSICKHTNKKSLRIGGGPHYNSRINYILDLFWYRNGFGFENLSATSNPPL